MTFYEKMRLVCLAIPEGTVAAYGQIAMLCGKPVLPGRWAGVSGRTGICLRTSAHKLRTRRKRQGRRAESQKIME